jgi:hypothetical protein
MGPQGSRFGPNFSLLDPTHSHDFVGYGPCRVLTGPDFQSVFNLHLWASNAKLINYYMFFGYANSDFFSRCCENSHFFRKVGHLGVRFLTLEFIARMIMAPR